MAQEPASRRGDDTHMKLLCSHGGRFQPCGPDGEPRYVGGETRVLVVPRAVSFRDLAARLAEMAAGGGKAAEVRVISIRHRLADDEGLEDVLVTVTCDEEVAHMRDEYDRLRATRPAARFRLFVTTTSAGPKRATTTAGLPPLAPQSSMRRVQSEQAVAARAQQKHRPTRRVHSALELAGGVHMQPSFHQHHHRHRRCCCCSCQRRDRYTPAPPPARPTYALPYMSKKWVAAPPSLSAAEAAGRVAAVSTDAAAAREIKSTSRDVETAVQNRRAIWELE